MPEPIVYVDRSRIHAGKLDEVRAMATDLVAFVREAEPQLISYGIAVDESDSTMTVVAVHPDSASLVLHMDVGGPRFKAFAGLIDLEWIEVLGSPSDEVVERLRAKAEMLGRGSVAVRPMDATFWRG